MEIVSECFTSVWNGTVSLIIHKFSMMLSATYGGQWRSQRGCGVASGRQKTGEITFG